MDVEKILYGYILDKKTYGVLLEENTYLEGLLNTIGFQKSLDLFNQIIWITEGNALHPNAFKDLCRRKNVAAALKIQTKLQDPYKGKIAKLILKNEASSSCPKYFIVNFDKQKIIKKGI